MDMITHILALVVALLAAVCLKLCHTIDFKNKALVKFIDENIDLKDAIMDMEIELQRQCDLIRALREKLGDDLLILATEGCKRCKNCTYPDAPCRFPESLHPSIESHGVEVNVLAGTCGIRYHNGKNTVTYHTCVFFNEPENN